MSGYIKDMNGFDLSNAVQINMNRKQPVHLCQLLRMCSFNRFADYFRYFYFRFYSFNQKH